MNWMIILNKEILKYKIGQISKTNEVVRNILLLEHVKLGHISTASHLILVKSLLSQCPKH